MPIGTPFAASTMMLVTVAIIIVPFVWLLFHYITGTYTDLYKKSRLQELGKTLVVTFFGSIIIFFVLLLDDYVRRYSDYYLTFTRKTLRLSSYQDEAIKSTVETWADAVGALA